MTLRIARSTHHAPAIDPGPRAAGPGLIALGRPRRRPARAQGQGRRTPTAAEAKPRSRRRRTRAGHDDRHGPTARGEAADIMAAEPSLAIWTVVVFVGLLRVLGQFAWEPLMKALHDREEHLEQSCSTPRRPATRPRRCWPSTGRTWPRPPTQVRALIDEARKEAPSRRRRDPPEGPGRGRGVPRTAPSARSPRPATRPSTEIWSKTADLAVSVAGKVLAEEPQRGRPPAARRGRDGRAARRRPTARGRPGHDAPRPRARRRRHGLRRRRPPSSPATTPRPCSAPASDDRPRRSSTSWRRSAPTSSTPTPDSPRSWPRRRSPAADKDRDPRRDLRGPGAADVVNFLRVLNRHGRLGLLRAVIAPGPADAGPPAEPQAGHGPLGRPARRSPAGRAPRAGWRRMIGATPVITLEVDPSLIGGLVVQVGDDVYDASVRNRLGQLRDRLIERKTHEIQSRRDHFSHPA